MQLITLRILITTHNSFKNFFQYQRLFSFYPYDTEEFHVKVISSIYYSILYLFTLLFFFNFKSLKIKRILPNIYNLYPPLVYKFY